MLDPRDRAHVEAEPDPDVREAMRCALGTYRRADRLAVGDRVPALALRHLGADRTVALDAPRDRPLVLLFGSFT